MFNRTLFLQIVASNRKLFFTITGVLSVLISIIMSVFVPSTIQQIAQANKGAGVNPLGDVSSLLAFVANQYYGMFAVILGIVYAIVLGNKLIAGQVDRGSMATHLSTPISRTELTFTSAIYLLASLAVMYAFVFGIGCGAAEITQAGELDMIKFLKLTIGFFLLQSAIGGITFAASCVFNRSSHSLAVGAGLPIFFFVAKMLSGMSNRLEEFKNVSLVTLYRSEAIIGNGHYVGGLIVLTGISIGLYSAGVIVFKRKDLPL
ncbi:ABC transporter permease [Paenibacillus lignilyticus]|uniref:ABC transporter permease subunit n=1 Tax=Paenibacillus lignilyticus TaxID=1172615 RepID=A0ABS5CGW9_9BACL|nr:ABC transporter permease subunit [Paenibacillus lignilyticus]MBP3965080.1 ABC transporter permease subunit [Paenibacillus lignilyticus]